MINVMIKDKDKYNSMINMINVMIKDKDKYRII